MSKKKSSFNIDIKSYKDTAALIFNRLQIFVFEHIWRGSNRICAMPGIKSIKGKNKTIAGTTIYSVLLMLGFLVKNILFIGAFTYLPIQLLIKLNHIISFEQKNLYVFCLFVICGICGSLVNTKMLERNSNIVMYRELFDISAKEYRLMVMYGRMLEQLVFYTIALLILGESFAKAVLVVIVIVLLRPVGEVLLLYSRDKSIALYGMRAGIQGVIIAFSILAAYALPYAFREVRHMYIYICSWWNILICVVISIISQYCLIKSDMIKE